MISNIYDCGVNMILWYGLGLVFPRGEYVSAYALRYLRYFLVGLWVTGLAPLVFVRFGLATGKEKQCAES